MSPLQSLEEIMATLILFCKEIFLIDQDIINAGEFNCSQYYRSEQVFLSVTSQPLMLRASDCLEWPQGVSDSACLLQFSVYKTISALFNSNEVGATHNISFSPCMKRGLHTQHYPLHCLPHDTKQGLSCWSGYSSFNQTLRLTYIHQQIIP